MPADALISIDAPAVAAAGGVPANLTERLRKLRDALGQDLVERDVAIRLALLAPLAGEHLLLVGPPGTAKSVLARRLHLAFDGASYFERLLTKFSVPEELFGPLSIKGLEEDRYERQTERYLPTAAVAFLDEIFKANSAILNALLTLLNEREFDNGSQRVRTPLISVVGASNELAKGEELDALFDRFLLRLHVGPVSAKGFGALLALRGEAQPEVARALRFTADELRAVQHAAMVVEVPEDLVVMLADLREWCAAQNIPVSDRRWRKVVKLLQVSALTNGRSKASIWDAWLVQHCLWSDPKDREKVYDWYAARVGASAAMDPSKLTKIVVAWEGKLKLDKEARAQCRDANGALQYMGAKGKPTVQEHGQARAHRGNDPLFLCPPNATDGHGRGLGVDRANGGKGYTEAELNQVHVGDRYNGNRFEYATDRAKYLADHSNWMVVDSQFPPVMEPLRHKHEYVQATLREVESIRADVADYAETLARHVGALEAEIATHLWVSADFAGPASASLGRTGRQVRQLLQRIVTLREGFEMLPREDQDAGPRPSESQVKAEG